MLALQQIGDVSGVPTVSQPMTAEIGPSTPVKIKENGLMDEYGWMDGWVGRWVGGWIEPISIEIVDLFRAMQLSKGHNQVIIKP